MTQLSRGRLIKQSCIGWSLLLDLKSCSTLVLASPYLIEAWRVAIMDGIDQFIKFNSDDNEGESISLITYTIIYMRKQVRVKRLQGSPYAIDYDVFGRGASATIVKAYNLDNLKQELVSKVVSISEEESSGVYKTELQILKQLPTHPNLVNYKKIQISSERNLYLIMEFCNGGNLDKYMFDSKYNISEDKIWFFLKQFCDGYRVLYDHSLIHRDIKPENILIHNGDFKIADFGLSKLISDPEATHNLSMKGTPIYMAPEIPQAKEGSSKVDVFSLGIVVYRMAFKGAYPFFDQGRKYRSISQYFKELKVRKLMIPPSHSRSEELVELIKHMLCKEPEERISWKELFEHPKIVKAVRAERRKEITSMEQFKRSLIFVNKSITKIQEFQGADSKELKGEETCLILEEAFNKSGKTTFERKLYRFKLIYTLIEYVSNKIKNYLKSQQRHKHIKATFNKLILQGLQFSLYVINSLRNISGQWEAFSELEIINFENIFDNDRLIIEDELEKIVSSPECTTKTHLKISITHSGREIENSTSKVIKLSYEDLLYTFLTQFWQYPTELRVDMLSIVVLLVDVYDLVIKFEQSQLESQENVLERIEDEESKAFYQYLMKVERYTEEDLRNVMEAKGLILS